MDLRRALLFPLLASACLAPSPGVAQAPEDDAPAKPTKPAPTPPRTKNARKIRSLVQDLGSPEWATREAAREALLALGRETLPYLEQAARDPDPERSANAKELLTTLRWLVPDELERVVGSALEGFPQLSVAERTKALQAFLVRPHEARVGVPWLITAARFDTEPAVRQTAVRIYLQITPGADPTHDALALAALADDEVTALVAWLQARLLQRLDRLDEAVTAVELALAGAGTNRDVVALAIDLYLATDQAPKALPLAKAAVERDAADLLARIRLGEVLVRAGEREEGLARLASVLGDAPKDEDGDPVLPDLDVLIRLGRAYVRCGEPAEAVQVYRDALGRYPFNRQLNVAMGDVFRAQGRVDEAVQVYLSEIRYVAMQPPSPEFLGLKKRLGAVLRDGGAGWLAEEESFYADAFRGRPVIEVRRAVAAWLRGRGLFDAAVEELRAVTALAPSAPLAWVELGDGLKDAGEFAAAKDAYARALKLNPKLAKVEARLRDAEALAGQGAAAGDRRGSPEGFALWETRVEGRDLEGVAEAVGGFAPPPLVVGEVVATPVPGSVALLGMSREDGRSLWRHVPEPPPREEGALPEQVGLEMVALVAVSPGVVAATEPRRARDPSPLLAVLYNAYWRPAHRSWRKAQLRGLYADLVDPADGAAFGRRELDLRAQVMPPAGYGRQGRLLCFTSPRRNRLALAQLDLVLARERWSAAVPKGITHRPLLVGDRVLVAWKRGVSAFDLEGQTLWTHSREAAEAPDDGSGEDGEAGAAGRAPLTTALASVEGGVVFGTGDGRLVRLDLEDGAEHELAHVSEGRLVGAIAAGEGKLFVAERNGKVHAVAGPTGEGDGWTATSAWTYEGDRAASRTVAFVGGRLFALNGSAQDFYADEAPRVLPGRAAGARRASSRPGGGRRRAAPGAGERGPGRPGGEAVRGELGARAQVRAPGRRPRRARGRRPGVPRRSPHPLQPPRRGARRPALRRRSGGPEGPGSLDGAAHGAGPGGGGGARGGSGTGRRACSPRREARRGEAGRSEARRSEAWRGREPRGTSGRMTGLPWP
jgi:tetratricopeptide (TPR) repeat protein